MRKLRLREVKGFAWSHPAIGGETRQSAPWSCALNHGLLRGRRSYEPGSHPLAWLSHKYQESHAWLTDKGHSLIFQILPPRKLSLRLGKWLAQSHRANSGLRVLQIPFLFHHSPPFSTCWPQYSCSPIPHLHMWNFTKVLLHFLHSVQPLGCNCVHLPFCPRFASKFMKIKGSPRMPPRAGNTPFPIYITFFLLSELTSHREKSAAFQPWPGWIQSCMLVSTQRLNWKVSTVPTVILATPLG